MITLFQVSKLCNWLSQNNYKKTWKIPAIDNFISSLKVVLIKNTKSLSIETISEVHTFPKVLLMGFSLYHIAEIGNSQYHLTSKVRKKMHVKEHVNLISRMQLGTRELTNADNDFHQPVVSALLTNISLYFWNKL